jgi:hypothetical protein
VILSYARASACCARFTKPGSFVPALAILAVLGCSVQAPSAGPAPLTESDRVTLDNFSVLVPDTHARLTPELAATLDAQFGSQFFAEQAPVVPLLMISRHPARGALGMITFDRLPEDSDPALATAEWCDARNQALAEASHRTLVRSELRTEAFGPLCWADLDDPTHPDGRLISATVVLPGTDWHLVCTIDDRTTGDADACDAVIRSIRRLDAPPP